MTEASTYYLSNVRRRLITGRAVPYISKYNVLFIILFQNTITFKSVVCYLL